MTIATNEFTIYSEAIGTIDIAVELEAASPSLVAYVTENRAYLDGVKATIDADLALFNAAVMSQDLTYVDSAGATRLSWLSLEAFVNGFDHVGITETVDEVTLHLGEVDEQLGSVSSTLAGYPAIFSGYNSRLGTLESGAGGQLVRIVNLEDQLIPIKADIAIGALANEQQSTDILALDAAIEGFTERLDNVEVTYADQNVLIDTQQTITTDHEERLYDLESITDYQIQTARFEAIEATDVRQDQALDDLALDLASEITDREAAITAEAQERWTWDDALQTTINTEVAERLASDAVLQGLIDDEVVNRLFVDAQQTDTINALDAATVKLTGPQAIEGEKTFTDDTIFEGNVSLQGTLTTKNTETVELGDNIVLLNAGETGSPSVDAGLEVERGSGTNASLIWDESADAWAAGLAGSEVLLADQSHVDANYLKLSGGTLTGQFIVDQGASTPIIASKRQGVYSLQLLGYGDTAVLRNFNSSGAASNNLVLHNDYASFDSVVRGVDPVDDSDFTTKGYAQDNFLGLNGGVVNGTITASSNASVTMRIDAGSTNGSGYLEYKSDDVRSGLIYRTSVGSGETDVGTVRIRRYDTKTGTATSELNLGNGSIVSSVPMFVPDSTNTSTAPTRGYVDTTFLAKAGGTLTGDLNTLGGSVVIEDATNEQLTLNASTNGNATMLFKRADVDVGEIRHLGSRAEYSYTGGATDTTMALYEDYAEFNKPIVSYNTTPNSNHLIRRDYVNDNFLPIADPITDGNLTIQKTADSDARLTVNAPSGRNAQIIFRRDGAQSAYIVSYDGYASFAQQSGAALRMYGSYSAFTKYVEGVDGTTDASFTTKGYVDDNFLALTGGALTGNLSTQNLYVDGSIGIQTDKIRARNNDYIYTVDYFSYASSVLDVLRAGADAGTLGDGVVMHKGYVDDNFVSREVSGPQTVKSDIFLTPDSGTPTLRLYGAGDTDGGLIRFLNGHQENAWINTGIASMSFRVFAERDENNATSTTNNEFIMKDDHSRFIKEVRCTSAITLPDALITKEYAEDNFLALTGGTMSGGLGIENTMGNSQFYVRAVNSYEGSIKFSRDDASESGIFSLSYTTLFRRYVTGVNSEFKINNDDFNFNKDINLDSADTAWLTLDCGTGLTSLIDFKIAGTQNARINGSVDDLLITHVNTSGANTTLQMNDDDITINKKVLGVAGTDGNSLVTKDQMDAAIAAAIAAL